MRPTNENDCDKTCENCPLLPKKREQHDKLMRATLFGDSEEVKRVLDALVNRPMIDDIHIFSIPTPIYQIALFNQMVWDPSYWTDLRDEYQVIVPWMQQRTEQTLAVWRDFLGVEELPQPEYDKYTVDDFFCDDKDESDEEVLFAPKENFLKCGCREIDVDLYLATCRFEFDKVEGLLQRGANPCTDLSYIGEDGNIHYDESSYHRIEAEVVYLALELFPLYQKAQAGDIYSIEVDWRDYENILGLAEHVRMEKLFNKYEHLWQTEDNTEDAE